MKKLRKTWVLVANMARARLFSLDEAGESMTEIESMVNPDARSPGNADGGSGPQTVHESVGPARHAIEPHTALREKQAMKFAAQLNDRLVHGMRIDGFRQLVLVAAPHFLGVLRANLDKNVLDSLALEIAHDFTTFDPREIRTRLPPNLV